jgi:hypothetical protein
VKYFVEGGEKKERRRSESKKGQGMLRDERRSREEKEKRTGRRKENREKEVEGKVCNVKIKYILFG